jgi:hypothetical protein
VQGLGFFICQEGNRILKEGKFSGEFIFFENYKVGDNGYDIVLLLIIKIMLKDVENEAREILLDFSRKEKMIKEDLLKTSELRSIQDSIISFLDKNLNDESITWFRYRKIKSDKSLKSWWSGKEGFPFGDPLLKIGPLLGILEQYLTEKTIKRRLKTEGFFIESRIDGEDQHLLVGKRDGTQKKAHIIIDGKTAEIRVEASEKHLDPVELGVGIRTIMTLSSGEVIESTRDILRFTE